MFFFIAEGAWGRGEVTVEHNRSIFLMFRSPTAYLEYRFYFSFKTSNRKLKFAVFICCNRLYSFIGWKIGFTIGEQSDNCPCKRFVGFSDLNTFDIAPDFFITDFYSNYLVIFTDRNRECFFCKNISCRGLNLGNNIFSVYYVLENKFAVFFSGNRCKSVFSSEFGFAVGEQSDNCAA